MKSSILITHEHWEGICFIDPRRQGISRNHQERAQEELETSVAPAMPSEIMKKNCGSGGYNKI